MGGETTAETAVVPPVAHFTLLTDGTTESVFTHFFGTNRVPSSDAKVHMKITGKTARRNYS